MGEFPGVEEIKRGIPFCGPTGDILRRELILARLPFDGCRVTNLWLHEKDEKNCDVKFHVNALAKEMKGRPYIFLMGSDLANIFYDCGIMEISGLEVPLDAFPKSRIFASVNPAIVLREPMGELRLAVERFAEVAHG